VIAKHVLDSVEVIFKYIETILKRVDT